uniref:Ig-like domain-containing protein n=1 Tax=Gopherus agassizii TaxID=38772 RepID=A0A452J6X9_9SAUR
MCRNKYLDHKHVIFFLVGCQKTPPIFQTPPRIIALNNSTMELVCALKSEQFTQSGIYWYRWSKEIQDFQYVLFSNVFQKHTITNNIDKDRFNVSKGSSRHAYTLKIRKLQPLDAGTYYCAVSHSSELLFGNGTELSVGKCCFRLAHPLQTHRAWPRCCYNRKVRIIKITLTEKVTGHRLVPKYCSPFSLLSSRLSTLAKHERFGPRMCLKRS